MDYSLFSYVGHAFERELLSAYLQVSFALCSSLLAGSYHECSFVQIGDSRHTLSWVQPALPCQEPCLPSPSTMIIYTLFF
jgi:hypothetical protein